MPVDRSAAKTNTWTGFIMTYEYICTACQHTWEAQQPITADPLKTCPACGKDTARRQVSAGAGFILKGGGWYADGYASAGGKKSEGESASGGPSSADKPAAAPAAPAAAAPASSNTPSAAPAKAPGAGS